MMPGNTIALYADDCKLTSRVITCPSDQQFPTRFSISPWLTYVFGVSEIWWTLMLRNANCSISRRKLCLFPLILSWMGALWKKRPNSMISDWLLVTSCQSWNAHVDKLSSKANKTLGLTKRSCKGLKDVNTQRALYCVSTSFDLHWSFRLSGKGKVDVYRMCMLFIVSTLVTPRQRCVMMHEIDVYKDRF